MEAHKGFGNDSEGNILFSMFVSWRVGLGFRTFVCGCRGPAAVFGAFKTGLWLARNEGMDPYSGPYITHYSSFHFLFHSFIPS